MTTSTLAHTLLRFGPVMASATGNACIVHSVENDREYVCAGETHAFRGAASFRTVPHRNVELVSRIRDVTPYNTLRIEDVSKLKSSVRAPETAGQGSPRRELKTSSCAGSQGRRGKKKVSFQPYKRFAKTSPPVIIIDHSPALLHSTLLDKSMPEYGTGTLLRHLANSAETGPA